jgi:hypothetical protein
MPPPITVFTSTHLKKNFPHLIRKIGKRRLGVTLYDAILLPPPDTS